MSLLEVLFAQKSESQNLRQAGLDPAVITIQDAIPELAQPYLDLQAQLDPALPAIYDAWKHDGCQVLLLENRSEWVRLLDCWRAEEIALPQRLYWLHEIAQLWEALEPWRCRQSLLVPDNLVIDEDQVLCLRRLWMEDGDLSLRDLGLFWQRLFTSLPDESMAAVAQLLDDLQTGAIATVDALQAQLASIASQFQDPPDLVSVNDEDTIGDAPALARSAADNGDGDADTIDFSELQPQRPASEGATASITVNTTSPMAINLVEEEEDDDDGGEDNAPTVVLPMQLVSLMDAGRTDVGRQRDHNEDYFGIQTEIRKLETPQGSTTQARGLFILCDGMGGHAGGEVASSLAVNTLRDYFQRTWFDIDLSDSRLPTEADIRDGIILANKAIFDINQESARSGSGRMGTTLVMVLVHHTKVAVAHVGDSRLYRVSRRSGLEQITSDHDVGQREVQRGVEPAIAYARPDALQLTQALGPRDENFINPDIEFFDLQEDTLLMLCSDGLADNDLLETHWRTHLEPLLSSQANLDRGVGQLIELANQYNGHDNITAIAVRLKMRPNMDILKRR
jgi:protein phosphatase